MWSVANYPASSTNVVPILFWEFPSISLLVHTLGDAHIYLNHIEQVRLQLSREPRALPQMHINPAVKDIFGFRYEDFELTGYDPHPHIKGAISV